MARDKNVQRVSKYRDHKKQKDDHDKEHRVDGGPYPQKNIVSRLMAAVNAVQSARHGQHTLARRPECHQRGHRDDAHGLIVDLIDNGDDQGVHRGGKHLHHRGHHICLCDRSILHQSQKQQDDGDHTEHKKISRLGSVSPHMVFSHFLGHIYRFLKNLPDHSPPPLSFFRQAAAHPPFL